MRSLSGLSILSPAKPQSARVWSPQLGWEACLASRVHLAETLSESERASLAPVLPLWLHKPDQVLTRIIQNIQAVFLRCPE